MQKYILSLAALVAALASIAMPASAEPVCKEDSIVANTPDSRFTINTDGTVLDTQTGLMWKRCLEGYSFSNGDPAGCTNADGNDEAFSWNEALQRADKQLPRLENSYASYSDWRLPNLKELRSIVEVQCDGAAINATVFPSESASVSVWSASPSARNDDSSWYVSFTYGYSSANGNRANKLPVRLVRDAN